MALTSRTFALPWVPAAGLLSAPPTRKIVCAANPSKRRPSKPRWKLCLSRLNSAPAPAAPARTIEGTLSAVCSRMCLKPRGIELNIETRRHRGSPSLRVSVVSHGYQIHSMNLSLFFRRLLIGFSIAAPVGPIGVLCIRRTLANGRAAGLATGLGAATADGMYGCVAGFGLTFISGILIDQQMWLRLFGGLFLCYLGIRTLLSKPAEQEARVGGTGLLGSYASTFLLTV